MTRRYSRQRELIYQAVMASEEHPTAEMVYNALKPSNPQLSLGTVYRNLKLLAEEGILLRMNLTVERYDANTTPHSHFHCRQCGRVYDLKHLPYDPCLDDAVTAICGHRPERHELVFSGVCAQCAKEQPA